MSDKNAIHILRTEGEIFEIIKDVVEHARTMEFDEFQSDLDPEAVAIKAITKLISRAIGTSLGILGINLKENIGVSIEDRDRILDWSKNIQELALMLVRDFYMAGYVDGRKHQNRLMELN